MISIKKTILIYSVLAISICAQEEFDTFNKNGKSNTKIVQTYRFDKVTDDGSYSIQIQSFSGDIKILGQAGSGGEIKITNIAFEVSENDYEQAHKLSRPIVKHLESKKVISIIGNQEKVDSFKIENIVEINMPININLNFQILGGDIYVENLSGETIIETLGGDILIKNYKGKIETKTNGGAIEIINQNGILRSHSSGNKITISESMGEFYVSCIGGDIFMNDLTGRIESQTSGGSIILSEIEGGTINCHSSGGMVTAENIKGEIKIKNSGQGINILNASGDIEANCTGGNISINDARGSIRCEASIGDIKMLNVSGSVESLNSNGNIFLELLYDSSIDNFSTSLENHLGNIEITIPKNLPSNIKSIIYQSASEKDLNSELPLQITTFYDRVTGTAINGDGIIPINLEAYTGSITIKEH